MAIFYSERDDIYYGDTAAEILAEQVANYPRYAKFWAIDTKTAYINNGSAIKEL
jgi:cytidylate kinase